MLRHGSARAAAVAWRSELVSADALVPAEMVLSRALEAAALFVQPLPKDDPLLAGAMAMLDRDFDAIWHDMTLPPEAVRFSIAHELAHSRLHDAVGPCGEIDIDPGASENSLPFGEAYITGYSPTQRREVEANVFAAELLAPGRLVAEAYLTGKTPDEIAAEIGIAASTIRAQLADALLLPSPVASPATFRTPSSLHAQLDDSQRAAATTDSGPTLVVAGPGTGKTRTLIARIEYLLQRGARSQEILALTFSNRAANEIRERLEENVPDAARKVWIGTFHALGLEILKRFGERLGLPARPRLLDSLDAVELAELHLAELELDEYEFLHDPALPMRDLLAAVSRAKDELKGPADYLALAELMAEQATGDEAVREAVKAREVARFYARWQEILQRKGLLDFGDLLYRSVALLREHPDIRDRLRREFRHVVVDEYQDINRASAMLVKELAGDGRNLWVVGDLRQAIYRFRGASPANVEAFEADYPSGRRVSLDVNYRSSSALVRLFSRAAHAIGQPAGDGWRADRKETLSSFGIAEAENAETQAEGIATAIRRFEAAGIALRDQAVLCRTNRQAEALGELLEKHSIPVVYLGNLFYRAEVKDLLALLSVACEGPAALRRVAAMAEYRATEAEVSQIAERALSVGTVGALAESEFGWAQRLHGHIATLAFAGDAYAFLTRYLFGASSFLRAIYRDIDSASRQKLLAIHQLLQLAREFQPADSADEHPQRAFLAHVRRLLSTGEETRLAIPASAAEIDGVRLMTAHAAKGLEFPVVFVPNLCEGMFPPRARGGMVCLPPGLVDCAGTEAEEEDRLFFVAVTRARDHLALSYPRTHGGRATRPSPLLDLIRGPGSELEAQVERWLASPAQSTNSEPRKSVHASIPRQIPLAEVEAYMRCPRQSFYRHIEKLAEPEPPRGYRAFARAARELTRWAQKEARAGRAPGSKEVRAQLDALWSSANLTDHAHGPLLRARLEAISERLPGIESVDPGDWQVELEFGAISLRPDGAIEKGDEVIVERHHLGRPSGTHRTAPLLSLYRLAAAQRGACQIRVVNRYLATGDAAEVPASPSYEPARIRKYERALQGIADGKYDADPADPNECNRCPFFLVCPQ